MRKAFTLIELLVVIAIIAILAVVVVLTLNPAQLLAQARDANRVSDMATLNSAIGLYQTDQSGLGSMGSSSTVYPSIFDASAATIAGTDCSTIGFPVLPTGYGYHCAASTNFRNASSFGWIPINFQSMTAGTPFGSLPVDPINQSSSRLYYTYTTNGGQFEVTAPMESSKYKLGGSNDVISSDGSSLSSVYARGTNLALEPLDYGDSSLVGYWPMDEGVGLSALDASGNGNAGTWSGAPAGTNSTYYSAGKVGQYAGTFNNINDKVTISSSTFLQTGALTVSAWVNQTNIRTTTAEGVVGNWHWNGGNPNDRGWVVRYWGSGGATPSFMVDLTNGSSFKEMSTPFGALSTGTWYLLTGVFDPSALTVRTYVNGVLQNTAGTGAGYNQTAQDGVNPMWIGYSSANTGWFNGQIDDVRIYNRALSAAEIQALYNAEK